MNTLEETSKTACEELIENNLQLRYRVEELEKRIELLKFMSKELIECSEPSRDPLKETRYICTSTFMTAEINKE